MNHYRPVALVILDGWGVGDGGADDAISVACTPNFKRLQKQCPHTTLPAHGRSVGLPDGQMGGSEVGHLCLGAGRIVYQDLTYLNHLIETGEFQRNEVLVDAMQNAVKANRALHLMGLVSPGGVHSHQNHIYVLLQMARNLGVERVYVHAFLDGRDVPPSSAEGFVEALEAKIAEIGVGEIATVSGRYYGMDRDNRWDRTKLAWDAIVHGKGRTAHSALDAVRNSYADGVTDEFVEPVVICNHDGSPVGAVRDGDSVIFFNFRGDRARQLTGAFNFEDFTGFDRGARPCVHYVCMMKYLDAGIAVAFSVPEPSDTLAEVLSKAGKSQLHAAETEKFAHVTFFFNGGREEPFAMEDRVLVPSPKVATYDLAPEMSARGVAAEVTERIRSGIYDFVIVNFANGDMVGHTGKRDATVAAVEVVDSCLGQVWDAVRSASGAMIITADHGNADEMVDPATGQPNTAHSLNRVPFILACTDVTELRDDGDFADVAPTILQLMGLQQPTVMTGRSLIVG
ncbi:MAG: 2,3-bisphosphoglycerate-independent phosphoglycerate mutase [Clostridia bacterium]|nr:2,3-bisphosphoglycerate-independent phosphoglycerate mutase [Clostridia bacterium]